MSIHAEKRQLYRFFMELKTNRFGQLRKVMKQNERARKQGYRGRIHNGDIKAIAWELKLKCAYCSINLKPRGQDYESMTIDHIVPMLKGGTNTPENITLCCHRCNTLKAEKDCQIWLQETFGEAAPGIWKRVQETTTTARTSNAIRVTRTDERTNETYVSSQ